MDHEHQFNDHLDREHGLAQRIALALFQTGAVGRLASLEAGFTLVQDAMGVDMKECYEAEVESLNAMLIKQALLALEQPIQPPNGR